MTRRSPLEELERAKTSREVETALDHAPHLQGKRSSGSHCVWVGPTGSCVAPTGHRGEIANGTRRSIVRLALAAGLFLFVLFVLAQGQLG